MKGGWRVSQPYLIPRQKEYMDNVVEQLKKNPPMKRHIPQFASTLANLELQKDPDYKRDWTAPLPDNVLARPDAIGVDELVGRRTFDPMEIAIVEDIRRKARNTLGQSELSSTSEESRERAVHHFMVSPPAELTEEEKERVVGLVEILSAPPPNEVWIELPWYKAIWHKLKGNQIRSDKK